MSNKNLLQELSGDEIYNKFYRSVPLPQFKKIVTADPKTVINGDKIVKLGAFSKLLIKLFQEKRLKIEDLPSFTEYLGYIYKYNIPVNINKINGLPDLYDLVKKYRLESNLSFANALDALNPVEYKILHNGQDWVIYYPLTQKAACYLGVNATWCTTWGPESLNKDYHDRSSHYNTYNPSGDYNYKGYNTYDFSDTPKDHLYILVKKSNPDTERYQFHFSSNQFMNLADSQIDLKLFLKKNMELTYFFYPSLINKKTPESNFESVRIKFLPQEFRNDLLEKIREKYKPLPLITAIIDQDVDGLSEIIDADNNLMEVDIDEGYVIFVLKNLGREVEHAMEFVQYCESSIENAGSFLYEDIKDYVYHAADEVLGDYFEEFYKHNSTIIQKHYGIKTYEQFEKIFFDRFIKNDHLRIVYAEKYSDDNEGFLIQHLRDQENNVTNIIVVEDESYINRYKKIKIDMIYFLDYIDERNIQNLEGTITNFLEEFVETLDIPEYPDDYEFNSEKPKYNPNGGDSLSDVINNFFKDEFNNSNDDEYEDDLSDKEKEKCRFLQEKLANILNKYFDTNNTAENDVNKIILHHQFVNCKDGTVDVTIINKETNQNNRARINVDSIVTYLQNYKLFEQNERQKELIKKWGLL